MRNIKALYFLQLLKFDKIKCLRFFLFRAQISEIWPFSCFRQNKVWKITEKRQNVHISAMKGQNEKIRALYFLQLLKLKEIECPYFTIIDPNSWDIATFSFFRFSRKNEKNLKNIGEEVIRDLSLKWSLEAPICSHQNKS